MDVAPNTTGVIMGCLTMSALITLAVDPCDLLGKPFTLETAVSLWPSNSVIQTQRRTFSIEPANIRNPLWTQEAYLVDRLGVDDNSVWYQEPVVEYVVSKSPTNTAGVLTGIRLYIDATNKSPVRALLSRYRIAAPSLTNMCMRFPNQAWTGIDKVAFREDRTIGTNNLPPVRVLHHFWDGWLGLVSIALPPEAPGLCRSVAVGAHDSSEPIIDLPLLRHPRAIHVLGEHDMWGPKNNSSLEKMKELREGDRAIAGDKIFRHLKELGVFPVAYIQDVCSRPPEDKGLYASHNMGIVVETAVSYRFGVIFDEIWRIFVNLEKAGKDVKIRIAEDRFLPRTEEECKKNAAVTFESRRYDGEYKVWVCEDGISFLINKDGDVCMVGVNRYHAAAMNEYLMRQMIRCHEAQSIMEF